MNAEAARHIARARDFLARGDAFYAKAADEMIAAQKADPRLSWKELGIAVGYSESAARKIVTWRTTASPETPFSRPAEGRKDQPAASLAKNRPEAIVEAIKEAPAEARHAILKGLAVDPDLTADLGRASIEADRERVEEEVERDKRVYPESFQARKFFQADGLIARMDYAGVRALAALQEVETERLSELNRLGLLKRLKRIKATCEWMIERLESGAKDIDAELAELLSEKE